MYPGGAAVLMSAFFRVSTRDPHSLTIDTRWWYYELCDAKFATNLLRSFQIFKCSEASLIGKKMQIQICFRS
ncbi:MAG: hypothetical protein MHMPM18_004147 [Marteilia pararefringens]